MEKILCYIEGESKQFLTENEIREQGFNVVLALSDWRSSWSEIVAFDMKHVVGLIEPTIWLTRKSVRVAPGKSHNT